MKGLKNVKVYIKNVGVVTTNIGIENGKIAYIGDSAENIEPLFETDGVVLPGFIDEHIHGAGGADAMDGTVEALQTISEFVAREGTTGFLATTMTQSPENITSALKAVKKIREKGEYKGAEVLGVHLEGPFISPKHVGAQPLEYASYRGDRAEPERADRPCPLGQGACHEAGRHGAGSHGYEVRHQDPDRQARKALGGAGR